ncbi:MULTISPECIES: hypothetical protein [Marinobacter]|uniref:hypothetical protein n=1 Tax=Marinobacter TaxID=2742 RepID=UPI001D112E2C|nr:MULTISPECIES: hypothetical protein [Marinobacter]
MRQFVDLPFSGIDFLDDLLSLQGISGVPEFGRQSEYLLRYLGGFARQGNQTLGDWVPIQDPEPQNEGAGLVRVPHFLERLLYLSCELRGAAGFKEFRRR